MKKILVIAALGFVSANLYSEQASVQFDQHLDFQSFETAYENHVAPSLQPYAEMGDEYMQVVSEKTAAFSKFKDDVVALYNQSFTEQVEEPLDQYAMVWHKESQSFIKTKLQ